MVPTRIRTKKVKKGSTIDFFLGGDPARTVKYHGFATTTLKNFTIWFIYRRVRKQEGAPPALAMDFFFGGPC